MRRGAFEDVGGFDTSSREASEDREFCDRWRITTRPLIWERSAVVEHRHAQDLRGFLSLHQRYGQGAYRYKELRRARASGDMGRDVGFHSSLLRLIPTHLRP